MKILILTKFQPNIYQGEKNVDEYVNNDHFFLGYKLGFEKLGSITYLNWNDSFFFPRKMYLRYPLFTKIARKVSSLLFFDYLDRILFTHQLSRFIRKEKIELLFTELNIYFDPILLKRLVPNTTISQWFGIFPENYPKNQLRKLNGFDYLWCSCEFRNDVIPKSIQNRFKYIGCAYNHKSFYHEFDTQYSFDLVFIGGISKSHYQRIKTLEFLAERIPNFGFYGYGIENLEKDSILREKYRGWASSEIMRKAFSSSKIALNLTLDGYEKVSRGFNARLFEISACDGAVQLLKDDVKIQEFFEPNKEVITYSDQADMLAKIELILSSNKSYRKEITHNALLRVQNKYRYQDNAEKILHILNKNADN